jgi:hypothetical protein
MNEELPGIITKKDNIIITIRKPIVIFLLMGFNGRYKNIITPL